MSSAKYFVKFQLHEPHFAPVPTQIFERTISPFVFIFTHLLTVYTSDLDSLWGCPDRVIRDVWPAFIFETLINRIHVGFSLFTGIFSAETSRNKCIDFGHDSPAKSRANSSTSSVRALAITSHWVPIFVRVSVCLNLIFSPREIGFRLRPKWRVTLRRPRERKKNDK